MKNRIKYEEAPEDVREALDSAVPVADFLPPPSQLVRRQTKEKITIAMRPSTIAFFKREAKANGTQYQTMINELLDRYVAHYSKEKSSGK